MRSCAGSGRSTRLLNREPTLLCSCRSSGLARPPTGTLTCPSTAYPATLRCRTLADVGDGHLMAGTVANGRQQTGITDMDDRFQAASPSDWLSSLDPLLSFAGVKRVTPD